MTHYNSFNDNSLGKLPTVFWCAYTSNEGVLWIGSWEGAYRVDPLRKAIPHFSTGSPVNRIYEDASGILWLGTNNGLLRNNRLKGTISRFVHERHNPLSISSNS